MICKLSGIGHIRRRSLDDVIVCKNVLYQSLESRVARRIDICAMWHLIVPIAERVDTNPGHVNSRLSCCVDFDVLFCQVSRVALVSAEDPHICLPCDRSCQCNSH